MDNNVNFGAATHVYFYSTNGRRIVSDKNLSFCQRYLVRQLNGAKNLKEVNTDLINTFKAGDAEYRVAREEYERTGKRKKFVRSVYEHAKDRTKAYVNIITGKDVERVDNYGKEIGKAKHTALERIGHTKSYETDYAIQQYNKNATKIADNRGIYKNGKRQAFGIIFEPLKNGKFKYIRSAFFDECLVR